MILPMWVGWLWEWVASSDSEKWMWIWTGIGTFLEVIMAYYGITPRFIKMDSRRQTFLVSGMVFYVILNTVIDFVISGSTRVGLKRGKACKRMTQPQINIK